MLVASLGAFVRSGPLAAGSAGSLLGLVLVLGWSPAAAISLLARARQET